MARGTGQPTKQRAKRRTRRRPVKRRPPTLIEREGVAAERALDLFRSLMALSQEASEKNIAERLAEQARQVIRDADPVRLSYAERVLGVSNPTVRDWAERGLLHLQDDSPQRVSLESVADTLSKVEHLREIGKDRDVARAVLNLLESEEVTRDDRFKQSLEQMRRGERRPLPY